MFYNLLQCGVVTQAEDKRKSQKFLRGSIKKALSSGECIAKVFDREIEDIGR